MNKKEIQNIADSYINRYYYNKSDFFKVRKYYNMQRDNADYAFLDDNYGIGNPFDVQFSSLLKLRIDILVGIFMSQELDYVIETIDPEVKVKEKEQQKAIKEKAIDSFMNKVLSSNDKISYDQALEIYDKTQKEYLTSNDISIFRKKAQHIVKYYTKNSMYDLYSKIEKMALDMFLFGEYIYRMMPVKENKHPDIINVLPERTFLATNNGDTDIQSSDGVVNIRYLTKRQVLNELGKYMTSSQKKEFLNNADVVTPDGTLNYYSYVDNINHISDSGVNDIYDGFTISEYNNTHLNDVVKVYHTEFKHVETINESNMNIDVFRQLGLIKSKDRKRKRFREDLYECYRIGGIYYIGARKVEEAERNPLDDDKVLFSYRGITFNTPKKPPTGRGYGLIDYQDMKDILIYIRNNIIANSGSNGSRINFPAIPAFMGKEPFDRIAKFLAYKKQGAELYDTSQKGGEGFNNYGDFSAMIDGNALQALDYTISTVDNFADEICGLTPQMRGQIEQRVAVNNVKTGIRMVSYANKRYHHALDIGISNSLMSIVARTRQAFRKGFSGTYMEGGQDISFEINPEEYVALKITVGVIRKDVDEMKRQEVKQLIMALATKGLATPETITATVDTDSIQDLKLMLNKGVKDQKEKNDTMGKMQQQIEQMNQAYTELKKAFDKQTAELKKVDDDDNKRKWAELDLKKKELENDMEKQRENIKIEKEKMAEIEKRNELEKYQVEVVKGRAAEVKNIKI